MSWIERKVTPRLVALSIAGLSTIQGSYLINHSAASRSDRLLLRPPFTSPTTDPPQTTLPPTTAALVPETTATTEPLPPPINIPWLPDTINPWKQLIIETGRRYGIDPELIALFILCESGGNPDAVSKAHAVGLMQIWPPTGASIARTKELVTYDLFDPATNLDFGVSYLVALLNKFGDGTASDRTLMLIAAGYNGGAGRANNVLNGLPIPRETATYMKYLLDMWHERHDPTSSAFERWLRNGDGNNGFEFLDQARQVLRARGLM